MLITVRSTHGPAGLDRFPKGHANVRVVTATTINTPDMTLGTTTAMVSQAFVETESTTTETGAHASMRLVPLVDGPIGRIFHLLSVDIAPPSAVPGATVLLGNILKDKTIAMVLDHSPVRLLNQKIEKKLSLVLPLEIRYTGAGIEMIVELTHKYAGQFVSFDVTLSMASSWKARPSAHVRETASGPRPGILTVKTFDLPPLFVQVRFLCLLILAKQPPKFAYPKPPPATTAVSSRRSPQA